MLDGISVQGLFWRVRRSLVGEHSPGLQYECRRCGHSMSNPRQHCPECGAEEMARYEF